MVARHRYCVVLVLGSLGPGSLGWALPPCGPPGTITTVTAPDGRDQEGRLQASGTYFLVLSINGVQESRKLTLLH